MNFGEKAIFGYDNSGDEMADVSSFDDSIPSCSTLYERSESSDSISQPSDEQDVFLPCSQSIFALEPLFPVDSASLDSISYTVDSDIFDVQSTWPLSDPAISESVSEPGNATSAEDLGEISVDNQKYPLDLCFPTSINQADASDSSSDNSSDSLSDNLLIGTIHKTVSTKGKKTRKAKRVWSTAENEKLLCICREVDVVRNHRSWNLVAKKLGSNRTAKQCREHYVHLTSTNKKSTWSEEENIILRRWIAGDITEEEMSKMLHRSQKQINERRAILERDERCWTQEEDGIIMSNHKKGKSVRFITKELGARNFKRTNQQVKDRLSELKTFHP